MNAVVFLGPTLSAAQARQRLPGTYLPPAARGDVYRACRDKPWAIAVIDGYFEHRLAVWHKEVLWALRQGIRVYGAASMGALRAAELAPFGMVGVGKVFELYRSGALEDEDEVAVIHQPAAQGYARVSEAMVDLRATLERAITEGVLRAQTGSALVGLAKAMFYAERSYPGLLAIGASRGLDATELARLREWLPRGRLEMKRDDALLLLERMAADASDAPGQPRRPPFHFEHTEAWEEFLRRESTHRRGP